MPSKSSHVKITAITIETSTVILPTHTSFFSLAEESKYLLKISRVKMVEIEFALPANEATMAAVKAAMERPFNPFGRKPSMAE